MSVLFCPFSGLLDIIEKDETPEETEAGAGLLYGFVFFFHLIHFDKFFSKCIILVLIARPACFTADEWMKAYSDRAEYLT